MLNNQMVYNLIHTQFMNMEGTRVPRKIKASDLCDFIGDFDFIGGKNIRNSTCPMDPCLYTLPHGSP